MLLPVMDTFLPENDRYLPTMPETAFKSGTYMQVPILTGIAKPISFPQYGTIVVKLLFLRKLVSRNKICFSFVDEIS